jgi:hypothetical protein
LDFFIRVERVIQDGLPPVFVAEKRDSDTAASWSQFISTMLPRLALLAGLLPCSAAWKADDFAKRASTLVRADNNPAPNSSTLAFSSLYIPDIFTTFAINLPTDNNDVNFFISAPTWMSWFGVGFGASMANSLMLVIYMAADGQSALPPLFPC